MYLSDSRFILGCCASAVLALTAGPAAAQANGSDFNGDGFADLAIGVPFESVGAVNVAGGLNLIYGAGTGLSSAGNQFWSQNSLSNSVEASDQFGHSPVSGDFNGDGHDDLAVGVPLENFPSRKDAGAVHVVYGSAAGLSAAGNQFWHQNQQGIPETLDKGDEFGFALCTGDFNGDGFDDLAIGVPREDVGAISNAGSVHVLYGSSDGLTADEAQFLHQNRPGMLDHAETGDLFGLSLDSGDFDGDGFDDLAVGVPGENIVVGDAGAVHVLYGSVNRLTISGNQFWHQESPGVPETAEANEAFGMSVAAGDFNGDGRDDLAVGIPFQSMVAGAAVVLSGSTEGLTADGAQLWHENNCNVDDGAEVADLFAWSLAAGDFNGDGYDELAIGVPLESVGPLLFAGAVIVLPGSSAGLTNVGATLWHQDMLSDPAEEHDWFGTSLIVGDYNGDGIADLAVGAPFEDIGGIADAGAVNVIFGSPFGLQPLGNQFWHQDSPGIAESAEQNDGLSFGNEL